MNNLLLSIALAVIVELLLEKREAKRVRISLEEERESLYADLYGQERRLDLVTDEYKDNQDMFLAEHNENINLDLENTKLKEENNILREFITK